MTSEDRQGRRPLALRAGSSEHVRVVLGKLLTWIQRSATWPAILGLLSAAGVLAFIMNGTSLPFSTPTIEDHSGGVRILDMRFSYGPEEANRLFEALGTEGRRAYLTLHLLPDILFPACYALAFACTSAWFLIRLLPLNHPLQWLSLTPLIAGLADVLENLSLAVVNLSYPGRIDWLTHTASVLTKIKFGLMPIGVVLLTALALLWLGRGRPASKERTRTSRQEH